MLRCMLHLCALSACLLFAWATRAGCVALCALCGVLSLCSVLVPGALSGSSWLWCSWLLASAGNYSPSHAYAYACAWHLAGCASGTFVVGPRLLCVLVAVFFVWWLLVAPRRHLSRHSVGFSCLCGTGVVLAYVRGCLHVDSESNLLLLRVDGCGPALALTQVCRSLVVSSYTVAHVGSFPLL